MVRRLAFALRSPGDTTLALWRGNEVLLPSVGEGCRLFDCKVASLDLGQDPGIDIESSKMRENRLLGVLNIGRPSPARLLGVAIVQEQEATNFLVSTLKGAGPH